MKRCEIGFVPRGGRNSGGVGDEGALFAGEASRRYQRFAFTRSDQQFRTLPGHFRPNTNRVATQKVATLFSNEQTVPEYIPFAPFKGCAENIRL